METAAIPGGRLEAEAAAAWNAGPAKAGLMPAGSASSLRECGSPGDYPSHYGTQWYFWEAQAHGGALAARPCTSNHGRGLAVDLRDQWMREWIDEHGHEYGWEKVEAFSEWWHVNYVGGWAGKPVFKPLRKGMKGPRVVRLHKLLRHAGGVLRRPKPGRYWGVEWPYRRKFTWRTERRVKRFQRDHELVADGVVGPKTWALLKRLGRKEA